MTKRDRDIIFRAKFLSLISFLLFRSIRFPPFHVPKLNNNNMMKMLLFFVSSFFPVTVTDFQKVLQELDQVLNNASFLAIDSEFTGLSNGPDANAFDTPAQYYAKVRSGSVDFLLVQFGLSIFTYKKTTHR